MNNVSAHPNLALNLPSKSLKEVWKVSHIETNEQLQTLLYGSFKPRFAPHQLQTFRWSY
jgi:hypothetical protein